MIVGSFTKMLIAERFGIPLSRIKEYRFFKRNGIVAIHKTAKVGKVQFGGNTLIGEECVIRDEVRIKGGAVVGAYSYIGYGAQLQNITIGEHAFIGNKTKIDAEDAEIGNNVFIGNRTRIGFSWHSITIKDKVYIGNDVSIEFNGPFCYSFPSGIVIPDNTAIVQYGSLHNYISLWQKFKEKLANFAWEDAITYNGWREK